MTHGRDVPLLRGTFTIRSPRSVLLLNPFQLPIVAALFVISVVFTVWPEALEHAAVSFEQRGILHHVWHYLLLSGSGLILWGMFSAGRLRLKMELIGLLVLAGVLGMNLTAIISNSLEVDTDPGELPGLTVAIRAALILGCVVRAYIVAREPTVDLLSGDMPNGNGD